MHPTHHTPPLPIHYLCCWLGGDKITESFSGIHTLKYVTTVLRTEKNHYSRGIIAVTWRKSTGRGISRTHESNSFADERAGTPTRGGGS